MPDAVRTGEVAFDRAHGMSFWAYCAAHPEVGSLFDVGITGGSTALARALLGASDFVGIQMVVDVGGEQGRLVAEVLRALPSAAALQAWRTSASASGYCRAHMDGGGEKAQASRECRPSSMRCMQWVADHV